MLSLFVASALASEAVPSYADQAGEVTDRIELGFRLCARHIVRQGILSSDHDEELRDLGVILINTVPDDELANTGPLFTDDRIFAKIGDSGSNVYVSTAQNSFACRVIVSDTQAALKGRVDFVDRLRATSAWTYDERRSGTANGQMKDELLLASGLMITIVNGPNYIRDEGKGIQVFVTIALLPPKEAK